MRSFSLSVWLLFGAVLSATTPEERALLPLPEWSKEDAAALSAGNFVPTLGGGLWPTEGPVDGGVASVSVADTGSAEQPPLEIANFLPPRIQVAAPQTLKDGPKLIATVSAEYLAECAAMAADQHFLDPWHHVPESSAEELEQFLAYHSEGSSIRAAVVMLGRGEQLPASVDLNSLATGGSGRTRHCLTVIPVAEPWRARIFLSQDVQSAVPPVYLANLAGDCIADAAQAADETEQLHRFLVRLSTRLFWLERMLPKSPTVGKPQSGGDVIAIAPTGVPVRLAPAPVLTEVVDQEPSLWVQVWGRVKAHLWLLLPVLGVLLGLFSFKRWRAYRMRHYEWILPDMPEAPTTFGARHAAVAAMVTYR
jgi:hypothetical protein